MITKNESEWGELNPAVIFAGHDWPKKNHARCQKVGSLEIQQALVNHDLNGTNKVKLLDN